MGLGVIGWRSDQPGKQASLHQEVLAGVNIFEIILEPCVIQFVRQHDLPRVAQDIHAMAKSGILNDLIDRRQTFALNELGVADECAINVRIYEYLKRHTFSIDNFFPVPRFGFPL